MYQIVRDHLNPMDSELDASIKHHGIMLAIMVVDYCDFSLRF